MSKLICIDPGHAKNTPGKRAGSNPTYYEYLSNRNVARLLDKKLKDAGFRTMYSCDINSPNDLSLSQRGANAVRAKADLFCSIHSNAHSDTSVTGTETFIHTDSHASLAIAQAVQSALVAGLKKPNRGVKRANFGVLRATYKNMLAILTEGDFFSNPEARKWMLTPAFDEAYAQALLVGICNFYSVTVPKSNGNVPSTPVQPSAPVKSDDVGKSLLRVKADKLWVYDKADWNSKSFQVSKGEAFTVARELTVNGSKMYQLISGLYITANTQFVEFDGKVESTPAPKPSKKKYSLPSATLRRGSKGNDVGLLQTALNAANFKVSSVDNDFGKKTEDAVTRFQKVYLPREVDGVAGPNTYRELDKVIN
ncbi:N-acetylmuramoyl-L-alanine amidase [Alkalihalobacillus sp. FSL W8-0930]